MILSLLMLFCFSYGNMETICGEIRWNWQKCQLWGLSWDLNSPFLLFSCAMAWIQGLLNTPTSFHVSHPPKQHKTFIQSPPKITNKRQPSKLTHPSNYYTFYATNFFLSCFPSDFPTSQSGFYNVGRIKNPNEIIMNILYIRFRWTITDFTSTF